MPAKDQAAYGKKRRESAEYRAKQRGYHRAWKLMERYGITPEDYDRMLAEQGGRCAICGTSRPGGRGENFHIDHCHKTQTVRGLLCQKCNMGLGLMEPVIDAARTYILGGDEPSRS